MPPLSTDYVFMSYSRRDDAVMRRIVAFLREQGIKVWVDNEKLIPGTPVWEKEIEKAVQGASAVVVVLSPDSKDSEWVRREISLADQYEKRVFPLLVRGDEKTSISIRLIGRQYVDIRSNEEAGLNYVSATLLRYLEELNEREQNAKKEADRLAAQKIKTEKRLAARKAEEERIALEKIATERKAKEDADRLSAQKAEEERIAFEKIAADRKAKEDADRLIVQKAEEERIALEKAMTERKVKEEADRLAAQKVELESKEKSAREKAEREAREKLAREKMERDEREKEKRETKVESTVEKPVVTKSEAKKQPGMKLPLWGMGLIAFAVLALIVWGLSSIPASPNATPTSAATQTLLVKPATSTAAIVPTPTLGIGSTEISPKDGMTLLYVPAGSFTMGSNADDALAECQKFRTDCSRYWFTNEEPPHSVSLDAFWIDQTEVTNAQYAKCVADNGACKEPTNKSSYTHSSYYGNSEFDHYPVLSVDWNMANSYCSWAGRELPSEAQWEKAASWDMATQTKNVYPWGNSIDCTFANFYDNKNSNHCTGDTTAVKSYESGKSPYGAYDMAGNVWEWVNGWYDVYPGGDPAEDTFFGQEYRVLRGGSWGDDFFYYNGVRSASRKWHYPSDTTAIDGFRCSRSP